MYACGGGLKDVSKVLIYQKVGKNETVLTHILEDHPRTDVSVVNSPMVIVGPSPETGSGCVGPLPFMACIFMAYIYNYKNINKWLS